MQISQPNDPTAPDQMVHWLTQLIAKEKKIPVEQIGSETPFVELGLDSMSAVALSGDIEMVLNIDLPPTLLWDCPNIVILAQFLCQTVGARKSGHP